ncbi:MAG TPA: ABC transporter permease [Gaiellaceae bacterium]|nr:ABC transporter permease [Gaiellaceae bacterium]
MNRVAAFIVRRLVASVITLLLMITLTFVIFWAIPTTPAQFIYPLGQHLSNYQISHANHLLGLDRPKYVQWWNFVSHIARGDFGKQWSGAQVVGNTSIKQFPVGPQLFTATRITGSIVLGGAVLVLLLALPLGAVGARFRNSIGDRMLSLLTLLAICTHPMVLGLILRTVFGDQLKWLPDGGYCTFVSHPVSTAGIGFNGTVPCGGGPWPWAQHLILPWVSFALLFLALYTRMSRASVLEVMHEDFVRTARAKGATEKRVIGIHVLPNAGLRLLTMIGMEIGTAIGVAVYIEAAFGMFGLGRLAVNTFAGSSALDLPLVLAVVTMITLVVIVGNLVVDLVYVLLDPRVGGSTMRARRAERAEPVVVG